MDVDIKFEDTKLQSHPLVLKAFELAKSAHEGQFRETSAGRVLDYLRHPVQVAELLQDTIDDYDPVLIAAALLHDTLEDTEITEEQILEAVGEDVLNLVKEVSLDNELKGKARREFQAAHIAETSLNAQRLKVADRLTNLMSMSFDPPENWSTKLRSNYLSASLNMIKNARISDSKLMALKDDILGVADRSVLLAVTERVREKGVSQKHWKGADAALSMMIDRAIFIVEEDEHLFTEDGSARQKYNTVGSLYSEAAYAQNEISLVLGVLSRWLPGVESVVPDELKDRKRAEEVIATRYKKDPRGISDLSRGSGICETENQARYATHCISQCFKIVELKDQIANPPMSAIRDIHMVAVSDRGHLCEIQVHLRHVWEAKKQRGDDIYKELRNIFASGVIDKADKKRKQALFKESRDIYKKAAEKHGFTDHTPAKDYKPLRPEGRKLPDFIIGTGIIDTDNLANNLPIQEFGTV